MQGQRDEVAREKGGVTHTVVIGRDGPVAGFRVTLSSSSGLSTTVRYGDDLAAARREFRRQVRSIGGVA